MKNKPNGIVVFLLILAGMAFLTHSQSLNSIPGVHVEKSNVSVDIGDLHYHN